MKKIAILTAYTDTNKWTSDGKCDFMPVSCKNHIDYCYKHNYSYVCELFRERDYMGYHPTWVKLFAIKKHLSNYDYIVWIDADCVFAESSIEVESFIQDESTYIVVPKSEKDYNTGVVWTGITTGFMIFKNNEKSHNLLDILINNAKNYTYDYFHEQSVLDNYFRDEGYYNDIPSLLCKLDEDLPQAIYVNGVGIIPYRYHSYLDGGKYSYVYHAGGNSLTKKTRLEKVVRALC